MTVISRPTDKVTSPAQPTSQPTSKQQPEQGLGCECQSTPSLLLTLYLLVLGFVMSGGKCRTVAPVCWDGSWTVSPDERPQQERRQAAIMCPSLVETLLPPPPSCSCHPATAQTTTGPPSSPRLPRSLTATPHPSLLTVWAGRLGGLQEVHIANP